MSEPTISAQDARRELIANLIREHVYFYATGLRPRVTSAFLGGFDAAADAVLAALRAEPARGAEEMPIDKLRHYPERIQGGGSMAIIDRQFGFVRCILPYDYRYTSNSQQWGEAARICRALEGPMSAQGVVGIRALPFPQAKGGEE